MRYAEQGSELPIPWTGLRVPGAAFAAAHQTLYGFDLPGVTMEIVTLRLTATGHLHGANPAPAGSGTASEARTGSS